jgi:hypothetical protein
MNELINKNREQLNELFRKHKVVKAAVFGSALTDRFNTNSDIDLLISFEEGLDPVYNGELWWSLYDELRKLFNKEIDLVTECSLKNPYFIDEIKKTRQVIYG